MSDHGLLPCDVVVVVRDHYRSTPRTVASLLDTTDSQTRIVVVAGAHSERSRKKLRDLDPKRVHLIGPRHHLVPNVARNLGLAFSEGPLVAFVDNDVVVETGWLAELQRVWSETGATAIRPVILQRSGASGPTTVHERGGECRIDENDLGRTLVDTHESMHADLTCLNGLADHPVGLLEFHCVMFDRSRLVSLGGFDPTIESQGEHLDLTLAIRKSQGEIWLAARSRATVEFARGVSLSDAAMFLGRWSPTFNRRSNHRFNEKWGITNPEDAPGTWGYAAIARGQVWLPLTKVLHRVLGRSSAAGLAARCDALIGRHIAEVLLHTAPGWRDWRHQNR